MTTKIQSSLCFLTPCTLQPEKPLFIFLPGMDGTGQLLRTQTAVLEISFDVRCLAIPPDDQTDWGELTYKVLELIRTEIANRLPGQPVYLCGESFGGCLALKLVTQAPELFTRIILVNPASSFHQRPWILWGGQIIRWFPNFLYELSAVSLLPFLGALERISISDRQAFLTTVQSIPKNTSIWRLSLLQSFKLNDLPLEQIKRPVLLIASGSDRLLPSISDAQFLVDRLPNVKLVILPNSGHACLLEEETNLYQILKAHDFLEV
jgi:pimeloyl-ACP methyl ester carboxylesterase